MALGRGYRGPNEIKETEEQILSIFEDEEDTKPFMELHRGLSRSTRIRWPKSTVWRYISRMVEEGKIVKEGEGRGAIYRLNRVKLMKLDHFSYVDKIKRFCIQHDLHMLSTPGAIDCSILGIPPEDNLTEYEQQIVQGVSERLLSTWIWLHSLSCDIARRKQTEEETYGAFTLFYLCEQELNKALHWILEDYGYSHPEIFEKLLSSLKEKIVEWAEENGLPAEISKYLAHFNGLTEQFDLENVHEIGDCNPPNFNHESSPVYPQETLALLVTKNMMDSKEFHLHIENQLNQYLDLIFENAEEFDWNKAQEIVEVSYGSFRIISSCGRVYHRSFYILTTGEKERLTEWNVLTNRYGAEITRVILDLVQESTKKLSEGTEEFEVHNWIAEKVSEYLREEGLVERYTREKFWH